jgi:hypothetical protein
MNPHRLGMAPSGFRTTTDEDFSGSPSVVGADRSEMTQQIGITGMLKVDVPGLRKPEQSALIGHAARRHEVNRVASRTA